MLALVLTLQAAAGPVLPIPRAWRATKDCPVGDGVGQDIVVCGRSPEADRLRPLPEKYNQPTVPKAEVALVGNVRVAAEAESATLAGGQQSNRLMVRLKLPF